MRDITDFDSITIQISSPEIINNTISNNQGGGVYFWYSYPIITNSIIWGNVAGSYSQIYECPTLTYSCIQYWTGGGVGNISLGPWFVSPANGDYRSQGVFSCLWAVVESIWKRAG